MNITDYFTKEERELLSQEASQSEKISKLTAEALDIFYRKRLFYLFVPEIYGGLQTDLPSALEWIEKTSFLDGSMGWTLTLGAGAGLFGAYMSPKFAKEIFSNPRMFIAGSGFPGGTIKQSQEKYIANGKWKYATGIDHATLITATCTLENQSHNNTENTKALAFYPEEVQWQSTWQSMGLKATGSHHFIVHDVKIPRSRTFNITPKTSHVDSLLYRYSFDAFAHCTLATSLLGMTRRFFEEAEQILKAKQNTSDFSDSSYSQQNNQFQNARKALYQTVRQSWTTLEKDGYLNQNTTNQVIKQSRRSCQKAIESVQKLYPKLGMAAIDPATPINRCWRDLHTALQHLFLRPKK